MFFLARAEDWFGTDSGWFLELESIFSGGFVFYMLCEQRLDV